jgi:hypothetical protein
MAKIDYAPYVFVNKGSNGSKIEVFILSPVPNSKTLKFKSRTEQPSSNPTSITYSFEVSDAASSSHTFPGYFDYRDSNPYDDSSAKIEKVIVKIEQPSVKTRTVTVETDDWDTNTQVISGNIAFQRPHVCLKKSGITCYPQILLPIEKGLKHTETKNQGLIGNYDTEIEISDDKDEKDDRIIDALSTNDQNYDGSDDDKRFQTIVTTSSQYKIKIKNKHGNPMPPPSAKTNCEQIIFEIEKLLNRLKNECICSDKEANPDDSNTSRPVAE